MSTEEPKIENKTFILPLSQDEATMLWWAIWEKEVQMQTRIRQFEHTNWPPECRSAAIWERDVLKIIREKLESLAK